MREKKKLTYADFKIGQKVVCTNLDGVKDFWEQHLTIGKTYIITDLEFRFPDSICVKTDHKAGEMFVPCKFFDQSAVKWLRKEKLKRLSKISKKR